MNDLKTGLIEKFELFEGQLNGAKETSAHDIRKSAIDAFNTIGLPTRKDEEYKYTNFSKALTQFDLNAISEEFTLSDDQVSSFYLKNFDCHRLVFTNGRLSEELSDWSEEKGLSIKSLASAFKDEEEEVKTYYSKLTDYKGDGFLALNTAFADGGTFIKVDRNAQISKPIALYFINDASNGEAFHTIRNLFVIEEGASVTFMEDFNTEGEHNSFNNCVTEIVVKKNSHVDYYKIQNNRDTAYHMGTTQVHQERDSVFSAFTFTLNGAMIRNNLNITVNDENCESNLYGLYLLNGKTHVDNHTTVDHKEPNCVSNELYKGILEDQAHGVFNGKVFVRKEAQKTNAFQSNKNILLSDSAVVNSKPQLEIWADDVKCSHGCTTGQIDDEALFYLRSRGIDKTSARALLLYAFAVEVLESVKLDVLKEYLEQLIAERLHKDF